MGQKNDGMHVETNSAVPPKATVLLVDQDREDLHYCGVMIRELGYRVRGCESYEEGADVLGSEAFDLIVVSQGSPNFEGRAVLKRAIEVDRRLPVLVVARCLDMGCYLEAMHVGAVDYLVEPLTMSEIGRVLENHLPTQSQTA